VNIHHVQEWSNTNPYALKKVNPRIYFEGDPLVARGNLFTDQVKSLMADQHSLTKLFKGQDFRNKLICGGFI